MIEITIHWLSFFAGVGVTVLVLFALAGFVSIFVGI